MSSRNLRIYKFGGASVKTADGVRNLANIVKPQSDNLIVVVSAMGKTTNALEVILADFLAGNSKVWDGFKALKGYHFEVLNGLFGTSVENYSDSITLTFNEIETFFKRRAKSRL